MDFRILQYPRNIDFYFYTPGSGGEFFTGLCSYAHRPTREILQNQFLVTRKKYLPDTNKEIITFQGAKYFEPNLVDIGEIGRHFFFLPPYFRDPKDKILYSKVILSHVLFNYVFEHGILKKREYLETAAKRLFKDKHIILCTHWVNFGYETKSTRSEEIFNSRTFGIPLFEKEKSWDVINLDPQTERAKNFVKKFCIDARILSKDKWIDMNLKHKAFQNIKLKFPFMDYILDNNFNAIKDYIENKYGPDIDYDFIDQSLIDYKKLRIDPHL